MSQVLHRIYVCSYTTQPFLIYIHISMGVLYFYLLNVATLKTVKSLPCIKVKNQERRINIIAFFRDTKVTITGSGEKSASRFLWETGMEGRESPGHGMAVFLQP